MTDSPIITEGRFQPHNTPFTGNQKPPHCLICETPIELIEETEKSIANNAGFITFHFGYYSRHDEGIIIESDIHGYICDNCVDEKKELICTTSRTSAQYRI